MNNGASANEKALAAVNSEKGFNFPRLIQNVVGAAMVAGLLGLTRCAIDLSDNLDRLERSVAIHVNDTLRKHELYERDIDRLFDGLEASNDSIRDLTQFKLIGGRFTEEEGAALEEELHGLQLDMAKLDQTLRFPFTEEWRKRIRDCETRTLTCCAGE